ncbi:MAG: hypothetical protein WDA06_10995 [Phenylobacterium sp.]
MIQKMSDQHKIGFIENTSDNKIEVKKEVVAPKKVDIKATNKLDTTNILARNNSISSARCGAIKDDSGPNKYIKSESSPSIWSTKDETVTSHKEATISEKENIKRIRNSYREEVINEIVDNLRSTDQSKGASISPNTPLRGSSYKMPTNQMSIFDNADFERISEKTAGEKLSEDIAKRRQQKDKYKRDGSSGVSSKSIQSKLFDSLFSNDK